MARLWYQKSEDLCEQSPAPPYVRSEPVSAAPTGTCSEVKKGENLAQQQLEERSEEM